MGFSFEGRAGRQMILVGLLEYAALILVMAVGCVPVGLYIGYTDSYFFDWVEIGFVLAWGFVWFFIAIRLICPRIENWFEARRVE